MTGPVGFDPSARVSVRGREELAEAVLERLDDGQLVMRLFDDTGEVVVSVSLRPDFLVRIEHGTAEAAA